MRARAGSEGWIGGLGLAHACACERKREEEGGKLVEGASQAVPRGPRTPRPSRARALPTRRLTCLARLAHRWPQEFKADLEHLEQRAAALVRLFGEDPAETEPQAILATLSKFLGKLETTAHDVKRRREAATRAAKTLRREGAQGSTSDGLSSQPLSPLGSSCGSARRPSLRGQSRPSLSLVSAIDSIAVERPTSTQRGFNAR